MKSHELIRQLLQRANAKQLASEMGLSTSLIYKWAEPGDEGGSGALNPLDRVEQLARLTDGPSVAQWVCAVAGGFYVQGPQPAAGANQSLAAASHEIVHEFADMLSTIAAAALDNKITEQEARALRQRWLALQSATEEFVRDCEHGEFRFILDRFEADKQKKVKAG